MKLTILIVGLIIMTSCHSQLDDKTKTTKEKVIKNIKILRTAGFFEYYKDLTDLKVYDTIYAIRKEQYSEIFKEPYDPGMNLDATSLAKTDSTKFLFLDLEADVGKDNNVYIEVIKAFSQLSNYEFQPKEITEEWESETGPIKVSFLSNGEKIVFEPEYEYDWLHESVFQVCESELEKENIRIVDISGSGQSIGVMRITKEEQKILEDKFNWKLIAD